MNHETSSIFRGTVTLVALVVTVVALTACGAHDDASAARQTPGTHAVTPSAPAATTTPAPAFTPDPYWLTPLGQVYLQSDSTDQGPRLYAEGTTTKNAQGGLASYHVASGDVFDVIATRFQMQWPALIALNCLRRDDSMYWKSIYAGDVLNLDPHAALSVGTQDGAVYTPTAAQRTQCLDGLPPQN